MKTESRYLAGRQLIVHIAQKTEVVNRTETMRFYTFVFTGNDPRKGRRIPLNRIKYNEQRDEETPIKEDDLFFNVSGATSGRSPCFVVGCYCRGRNWTSPGAMRPREMALATRAALLLTMSRRRERSF